MLRTKRLVELESWPLVDARSKNALIAVSVVILTCNEESNIGACLQSVRWAEEVFVVDSGSTDRTVAIAERLGAKVICHAFEGYAKQRNWALENLCFSGEWILMLDADEQIPESLANAIAATVRSVDPTCEGYYIKRRFIFLHKWLKYGGLYPTWILRLFKRGHVRFEERPLNEHAILDGKAGYLKQPFDHEDRKSLSDWIPKHNRYSDLEMEEFRQEMRAGGYDFAINARIWGSQPERKRWLKLKVWNRLPLLVRPFLYFFRNYFWRLGFLDGRPGLIYHILWSFWYPFLISAKIIEKQQVGAQSPEFYAPPKEVTTFAGIANVAQQPRN